MASTPQQRLAARGAYVYQRKSLDQIARLVGVDVRTVSRWKNACNKDGDDWDLARTSYSISAQGTAAVSFAILEDFMQLFQTTVKELNEDKTLKAMAKAETIARLSDAYNKTMAAAAKSSPEINKLAMALDVLHDLAEFLKTEAPQHAAALLEVLEPFGAHLSKKYG